MKELILAILFISYAGQIVTFIGILLANAVEDMKKYSPTKKQILKLLIPGYFIVILYNGYKKLQ